MSEATVPPEHGGLFQFRPSGVAARVPAVRGPSVSRTVSLCEGLRQRCALSSHSRVKRFLACPGPTVPSSCWRLERLVS
jgi:hypothetical protein